MLQGRKLFFHHPPRVTQGGPGSSAAPADKTGFVPQATRNFQRLGQHFHARYPSKPCTPWPEGLGTAARRSAPPLTARAWTESLLRPTPGGARRAHGGAGRAAPLGGRRLLPVRPSPTPRPARHPRRPAADGNGEACSPAPAVTTLTAARETRGVTRRRRRPAPSHKAARATRACAEGPTPAQGCGACTSCCTGLLCLCQLLRCWADASRIRKLSVPPKCTRPDVFRPPKQKGLWCPSVVSQLPCFCPTRSLYEDPRRKLLLKNCLSC